LVHSIYTCIYYCICNNDTCTQCKHLVLGICCAWGTGSGFESGKWLHYFQFISMLQESTLWIVFICIFYFTLYSLWSIPLIFNEFIDYKRGSYSCRIEACQLCQHYIDGFKKGLGGIIYIGPPCWKKLRRCWCIYWYC